MAMDWLNENALRAYPFVEGSVAGTYQYCIVDALFTLGTDFAFDYSEETSELRLVSVVFTGPAWELTVGYYQHGAVVVGVPPLVFVVPIGAPRHTVIRAQTAGNLSHGFITVGDVTKFNVGTPGAAFEIRTVISVASSAAKTIKVYNADRRAAYRPYFTADPGKTPAQNYTAAKTAAPYWAVNRCMDPAEGTIPAGTCTLLPGFNVGIQGDPGAREITFTLSIGAGVCRLCGIYDYVLSKVGTSDPCADLNGDGIVDAADVVIAADLTVAPKEITYQGVLRTFNGTPAVAGELRLSVGRQCSLVGYPEQQKLVLEALAPNPPEQCAK